MSEAQIRLAIFVGLFVTLALLELLAPRREVKPVKARRWMTNIGIVILDSVIGAPRLQGRGGWRCALGCGKRHRPFQQCRGAVLACGGCFVRRSRFRRLAGACGKPQDPDLLAHSPHASFRRRIRPDDRGAVSPDRDRALHGVEIPRRAGARRSGHLGADLRGRAQRSGDVQPCQSEAAACGWTAGCVSSS